MISGSHLLGAMIYQDLLHLNTKIHSMLCFQNFFVLTLWFSFKAIVWLALCVMPIFYDSRSQGAPHLTTSYQSPWLHKAQFLVAVW